MVVVAVNGDGRYYIPDIVRDKMSLSERISSLMSLVNRWTTSHGRPEVFYEQSGLS